MMSSRSDSGVKLPDRCQTLPSRSGNRLTCWNRLFSRGAALLSCCAILLNRCAVLLGRCALLLNRCAVFLSCCAVMQSLFLILHNGFLILSGFILTKNISYWTAKITWWKIRRTEHWYSKEHLAQYYPHGLAYRCSSKVIFFFFILLYLNKFKNIEGFQLCNIIKYFLALLNAT